MSDLDAIGLDFVPLGTTGLQTSEIQFGTWRFGKENDDGEIEIPEAKAHALLDAYARAGGRFLDTADVYGEGRSERWIGSWLADRDRERYTIASKIYWQTRSGDPNSLGTNRKNLRHRLDGILDRLGTDYLDVLYLHRWYDDTPPRQVMKTLNAFVDDGRVHYLGISTKRPDAWKVARANEIARANGWTPFTIASPRYNLVDRAIDGNYRDMADQYGIGLCTWSPLGEGFLTGKYDRDDGLQGTSKAAASEKFREAYFSEAHFDVVDELRAVADAVDATPAQTALAWVMNRVSAPIVGARTVDQLEENLAAARIDLSEDLDERLTTALA